MSVPILLTGGTQRIGLALAKSLLQQDYRVIVTYRRHKPAVDELSALGASMIQCDFEQPESVDALINHCTSSYTVLRAIIHNASDWDAESNDAPDLRIMQKMMQIHVNAPYQINWALQSLLTNNEALGDIIHMTDYVQDTGSAKHIAYSASKAALHNLTLSFARKLAPKVKVNSVAPALVMFTEGDSPADKAKAQQKLLIGKVPGAIEAVKAENYLLNSEYMTGQTLHLNGGRHLK